MKYVTETSVNVSIFLDMFISEFISFFRRNKKIVV